MAIFVIVGFATTFDNVKKRFFFGEMTSNQEVPILNQFDGDMQALEEGGVIIDAKEPIWKFLHMDQSKQELLFTKGLKRKVIS